MSLGYKTLASFKIWWFLWALDHVGPSPLMHLHDATLLLSLNVACCAQGNKKSALRKARQSCRQAWPHHRDQRVSCVARKALDCKRCQTDTSCPLFFGRHWAILQCSMDISILIVWNKWRWKINYDYIISLVVWDYVHASYKYIIHHMMFAFARYGT